MYNISPDQSSGDYTVSWTEVTSATKYILQEAANLEFTGPKTVYTGSLLYKDFKGISSGTYYYRVLASNEFDVKGGWSKIKSVKVTEPNYYIISGTIHGASNVLVTLSGDATGSQTVSSSGGSYSFTVPEGKTYSVTPSKSGYTFSPSSKTFTNVTSNQNQDFITTYTLTMRVNPSDGGSTSPAGSASYDDGTVVTITAAPALGYRFVGWTGSVADTGKQTTTVTVTGNMTVTANFMKFTEPPIDILLVSISAGTFRMGDVENYGQYFDEKPVHEVTLSSFEMSVYEVTQGQYTSVMGSNPANSYGVGDDYPVYNVSWYDAVKFCNKLSDAEGLERCYNESTWSCDFSKNGYRLPTEAEWEYACRAGTETYFYTGNNLSSDRGTSTDLDRACWYWYNWGQANDKAHVVGAKEPNAFGLYDMHGNVWEWCNDWDGLYTSDSQSNPKGPSSGSARVIRGGSRNDYAENCRSAFRYWIDPSDVYYNVGLRVVRRP